MANLGFKLLKLFASNATNSGQFGSAQLGTKVLSDDPDVLQALSAWENGWLSAVISGQRLPTLEEMQAVQYVLSYGVTGQQQWGIWPWSAEQTYGTGSITNVGGVLYKSLQDNNVGNDPASEPTWWENIFNIPDNSITNAQLADMAGNTVKVRANATDGVSTDLVMPASTFLARLSSGNLKAASVGEIVNLLGFAKSLAQNSYIKLPDSNIYIQFGRVSQATAGDIIHTFPITFPNNVLMVNGLLNVAMTTLDTCSVHTITTSGCSFSRRRMTGISGATETTNSEVWWIAIGN